MRSRSKFWIFITSLCRKCGKINIDRFDEGFVRIWNLIRGFDGFGAKKLLFRFESTGEVGRSASV